jgi:hypothetical protein
LCRQRLGSHFDRSDIVAFILPSLGRRVCASPSLHGASPNYDHGSRIRASSLQLLPTAWWTNAPSCTLRSIEARTQQLLQLCSSFADWKQATAEGARLDAVRPVLWISDEGADMAM